MSVKEIEAAIAQLPPQELAELISWFDEFRARAWDEQIADDLEAGRLDHWIAEIDREYEAGQSRPL